MHLGHSWVSIGSNRSSLEGMHEGFRPAVIFLDQHGRGAETPAEEGIGDRRSLAPCDQGSWSPEV